MKTVKYRVHSAQRHEVDCVALFNGRKVVGKIPSLVVELVRENPAGHVGHTFKFVPESDAEFAADVALFKVGAVIDGSFGAHDPDADAADRMTPALEAETDGEAK